MESLSDTDWDVVISGTGLQHSLLALALSRSAKNILHVDASDYYGGAEAALSLPELDSWAAKHQGGNGKSSDGNCGDENEVLAFSGARISRPQPGSATRGYSIALAPQIIHTRAALLSQLVSSKAFRQIEFLAVGSFFVYHAEDDAGAGAGTGADAQAQAQAQAASTSPSAHAAEENDAEHNSARGARRGKMNTALRRIPSTREDVFSNAAIPVKAKRSLMKFLKFVLELSPSSQPSDEDNDDAHTAPSWKARAQEPLAAFLASEFHLDAVLQAYIATLTLSLHGGSISVERGLAAIHRHLSSMGVFGAGFAAVYPKWGGLSEIAQVGCRASAVGGAVYMLGVGIKDVVETHLSLSSSSSSSSSSEPSEPAEPAEPVEPTQPPTRLGITLANDIAVKAKRLVQTRVPAPDAPRLSRLTAVIQSKLPSLFETVVDGAPTPSVAVVAFPAGCSIEGASSACMHPIYAMVHSADTGECPAGQCVIYLSTLSSPSSTDILPQALAALLSALPGTDPEPPILYQLSYEQKGAADPAISSTGSAGGGVSMGTGTATGTGTGVRGQDGSMFAFDLMPLDLAFDDAVLDPVRQAWDWINEGTSSDGSAGGGGGGYMDFKDREGVDDDDDLAN